MPKIIGDISAFLLLIVFFFDKKNNGFYLAFFLLLLSSPGMLLSRVGNFQLLSLSVPGFGREIFFNELISFTIIFKSIFKGVKVFTFYRKQIIVIIIYSLILFFIGFARGMNILTIFKTMRYLFPLLLFFSVPSLLSEKNEVLRFISLIFYFSIFCFLAQLVDIVSGHPFSYYLGDTLITSEGDNIIQNIEDNLSRVFYGQFIIIISFIISLYLTMQENIPFKRNFLKVVAFVSFFSVFLSATRGWIIGFGFILLIYFLLKPKNLYLFISGSVLLLVFLLMSPILKQQTQLSLNRFETITKLIEGDITAGGTSTRLNERSPKVMKKFRESPLFGYGFSEEYYKNADIHVGNQTLLLNGGIIGYMIYLYFWLYFIIYCYKHAMRYKRTLLLFAASFFGLLIIHSSSRIIFNYSMGVETAFGLSILFYIIHLYISKFKGNLKETKFTY